MAKIMIRTFLLCFIFLSTYLGHVAADDMIESSEDLFCEELSESCDHTEQDEGEIPEVSEGSFLSLPFLSLVNEPWEMPYCKGVKVFSYEPSSGETSPCSGIMIGPDIVLTAGHCIYDNYFGYADYIWVYPGWDGNFNLLDPRPSPGSKRFINHYGYAEATDRLVPSLWMEHEDNAYDIGVIHLDRAVGFLTGIFVKMGDVHL